MQRPRNNNRTKKLMLIYPKIAVCQLRSTFNLGSSVGTNRSRQFIITVPFDHLNNKLISDHH